MSGQIIDASLVSAPKQRNTDAEKNEAFIDRHGFRSQVHHRKSQGRPMAPHIRRGNAARSKARAAIEHVFAQQKGRSASTPSASRGRR